MATYRVEFDDKEIKSIGLAEHREPIQTSIQEQRTGETIIATIEAENDEEAKEKAERLAEELQTRKTKRQLNGDAQDARAERGPRDE